MTNNIQNKTISKEQLNLAKNYLYSLKNYGIDSLFRLDYLYVRKGYKIDSYLEDYTWGSHYILYPRRLDANKHLVFVMDDEFVSYTMKEGKKILSIHNVSSLISNHNFIIEGKQGSALQYYLPSIFSFVTIRMTQEGIWHLYLLYITTDFLHLGWHSNYRKRKIILSQEDLDSITKVDCSAYKNVAILPTAYFINSNTALVECCFFNDWVGLYRERIVIKINVGEYLFVKEEKDVLVEYKCGIMF